MSVKEKAAIAYDALEDKKGNDIKVIDISKISVMADYFVIADAENYNQVDAMADNVEEQLLKAGYHCKRIEGKAVSGWVLMDYGDIIVHVFNKTERVFYDLERLWRDGSLVTRAELE